MMFDTRTTLLTNRTQLLLIVLIMLITAMACLSLRNAYAATTNTSVDANIVSTINLVAQNGIVFGDISASSIPGSVTIDVDGSRTTTGGATVNSNTSATPARYEVTGDPNALYNITLPVSVVITSSAGDNMVVDNFISSPSASGQLDSGGRQNLTVGATMRVGSFQPFGAYTGVLAATVEYN